jgi:hypothetical protein
MTRNRGSISPAGPLITRVRERLGPFSAALGADREGYTNHVVRVLAFCDELHQLQRAAGPRPSDQEEFLVAAVFHDLGIWTHRTFDYLEPSMRLAEQWLERAGRSDLRELVGRMISSHHKLRRAGGRDDPVELLRRADAVDVSLGLVRFGLPRSVHHRVARTYPNAGFHRTLVGLSVRQLLTHPLHPAPMVRW